MSAFCLNFAYADLGFADHSGRMLIPLSVYYLFCQNAIFGISLLEAGVLVIPLCGVMLREAASPSAITRRL